MSAGAGVRNSFRSTLATRRQTVGRKTSATVARFNRRVPGEPPASATMTSSSSRSFSDSACVHSPRRRDLSPYLSTTTTLRGPIVGELQPCVGRKLSVYEVGRRNAERRDDDVTRSRSFCVSQDLSPHFSTTTTTTLRHSPRTSARKSSCMVLRGRKEGRRRL